jgi:tetratricopeptide (TPR) repeat protein
MIRAILTLWLTWQAISPEALKHFEAATEADRLRQFDVAVAEFRKVTELEPAFAQGFVSLGQAYIEQQNYNAAVTLLKHALELDPNLGAAHQLLGYALLSQGYYTEAISHLERVDDPGVLGVAQLQAGKLPEAIANLQAALVQQPDNADLLYYLGRASGLFSKQVVDTMMARYPDSPRAHQAMAENYYVLRQMPQAEKDYREALRLRPDLPEVHMELGEVYASSGQWDKAEAEFRAQTKMQPGNAEAAYRLGNALLQQGKAKDARPELQRADRLLPDMPETLYSLGKAAALEGDAAAAEKAWNKLLEIEKGTPLAAQAHFALAGVYRKQGKTVEAEREMKEFEKLQGAGAQP